MSTDAALSPEQHLRAALEALGFQGDPEMARTPALVAAMLAEFLPGRALPPLEALPTASRDLVVLRDLPFHSLCAHHLLPFFGTATLALRPDGRVTGLGALARTVEGLSRQPQLQERLASQIADAVMQGLAPRAVGVRLVARHMCVEMRGARVPASVEVVAVRGVPDDALSAALRG